MKTINIIGCGNVGKALARVWTRRRVLKIQGILNRSRASAEAAAEFVGDGRAVDDYAALRPAELVMIGSPDQAIEPCCRRLSRSGTLRSGTLVFHCSGSLASTLLEPARSCSATVASLHPIKSFPDPTIAAETFEGTFCALEGDPEACDVLREIVLRSGAIPLAVRAEQKAIYHAATVFVCNYLTVLMEVGLRCFAQAGVPRATAMQLMEPIVRGTVDNVFRWGPSRALTGPIARGEQLVVAQELEALGQWDGTIHEMYKRLGQIAAELAAAEGLASSEALSAIQKMLAP